MDVYITLALVSMIDSGEFAHMGLCEHSTFFVAFMAVKLSKGYQSVVILSAQFGVESLHTPCCVRLGVVAALKPDTRCVLVRLLAYLRDRFFKVSCFVCHVLPFLCVCNEILVLQDFHFKIPI